MTVAVQVGAGGPAQAERPAHPGRPPRRRVPQLDALRGLAILLMVCDHCLLIAHVGSPVRLTLTRLAMPIFFVLSGHLLSRWNTERHMLILGVGLALPAFVPWIDRPNVLAWYVVGAALLRALSRFGAAPLWLILLVGLTDGANGWGNMWAGSYDPVFLFGLMAAGRLIPRAGFVAAGGWLPAWMAPVGRFPVSLYVGHLAALELLRVFG